MSATKNKGVMQSGPMSSTESVEVAQKGGESVSGEALPEGWADVPIGDLCDLINGRAFKPKEWSESGLPIIRIQNLNKAEAKYNHYDGEYADKHLVRPGELLFAWSGTPGTSFGAHIWNGPIALLNQHIFRVLIDEGDLNMTFFRFAINHKLEELIGKAHGGVGLRHVTKGKFEATQVPLPPKAEQSRIVSAIESLQERSSRARVLLSEVGPLIGQLRQSVLRGAFSGRLTADWRASQNSSVEPASELLLRIRTERRERWEEAKLAEYTAKGKEPPKGWEKRYKEPDSVDQSKFAELPEGWCWVTIDQISNRVSDGVHKKPNYVESGIPFLRVKNLTAGPGISFAETTFITQEDHEDFIRRTHPEKGDVLVTKDGTLGVIRLIDVETVFSIFVSLALIKPVDKRLGPFIAGALESPHGQAGMKATGSGLQHIHLVDLRATVIPLAPTAEQEEIIRLVAEGIERIDELERGLASMESSLTQLDQSILSKAFRGELVPQDPRDEPASELLARIRTTRGSQDAKEQTTKATKKKTRTKK